MSATPPVSPPIARLTSVPVATTQQRAPSQDARDPTERTRLLSSSSGDTHTVTTFSFLSVAFFLQGLGMLFPWNALISNPSFFATYLFAGSRWQHAFENWFAFNYLLANACTTAVTLRPVSATWDRSRTLVAFAANAAVFACLVVVAGTVSGDQGGEAGKGQVAGDPEWWFAIMMVGVSMSGVATAIVQSHLFAVAARVAGANGGEMHTTMMVIGQAVSGVIVCLLQLMLTSWSTSDRTSAIVYFSTSVAVLVSCLLIYLPMARVIFTPTPIPGDPTPVTPASAVSSLSVSETNSEELFFGQPLVPVACQPPVLKDVVARVSVHIASLFLNFTITLSLFPALSALISTPPTSSTSQPAFTALLFLAFNLGDTLGRSLPHPARMLPRTILGATLARALFIPLFLVLFPLTVPANPWIPHVGDRLGMPIWVAVVVMVAMAASSGWVAKVCLAEAPGWATRAQERSDGDGDGGDGVASSELRGIVGRMTTLSMLCGLAAGSAGGFLVVGAATMGSGKI